MSLIQCCIMCIASMFIGMFIGMLAVYYNIIILPQKRRKTQIRKYPQPFIKPKK